MIFILKIILSIILLITFLESIAKMEGKALRNNMIALCIAGIIISIISMM